MKKLFGFLVVALIGFTACEGPMGPPGPRGDKGDDAIGWFAEDYDVFANQWRANTEEDDRNFFRYFEYEVRFSELTEFVFNEGFVGCYLVQEVVNVENGKRTLVQKPLPYTVYGFDDEGAPYSENYSFETRAGYVNFIVKYSDFSNIQPPTCTFHVVMIW